jgi:ATPase subunit of ABC transporter with duplicated ATPase domains
MNFDEAEFDSKRTEAKKYALNPLSVLVLKEDVLGNSVASLSVGWKMRLVLAKLLLQKADFFSLYEPDKPTLTW